MKKATKGKWMPDEKSVQATFQNFLWSCKDKRFFLNTKMDLKIVTTGIADKIVKEFVTIYGEA
jgi:hypothetical protein